MSARVSSIAAPGSLLKSEGGKIARTKSGKLRYRTRIKIEPKPGARQHAGDYLALVRRCPCLACDNDPAGVAAHVRMSSGEKPTAGMGAKPGDKWALPLCDACHTSSPAAQHVVGEVRFWNALGLDPLKIAAELWLAYPQGVEAMRETIFRAREARK